MATWSPELAVEILSKSNSTKEIDRKLAKYFANEVCLVWVVDPSKKTVKVYTGADTMVTRSDRDQLDGGDVLPGFSMSIRDWFAKVE